VPWTHDIGPFYWHTIKSPGRPARWTDRAWTQEVEEPYREGRGWACRIGIRRVLVVGRWHHVVRDEDDALTAALGASVLPYSVQEIKNWDGGVVDLREADEEGAGLGGGAEDRSYGYARIRSLD